ncbi:hypothetical protein BGW36DRAFT_371189 [Talaromyces proteolyticus]|uniref:Acyltransferase 3 domain-containing protein n=1 Tax=Talaromyces proteolyticus TaxID=1131652 RepID=A0AAD4Q0V8_9EURO|nr:uncharacterized protein BGW36DRAFT_371189 [Talaromyces proteolyticus]KAH8701614.1 hypothetical protein BGW36DRAFT_371189 [Talaromyces proteolyticus]
MPAILRGSFIVYLLIVATAAWRSRPRLIALAVLSIYFLWLGMWDVFAFIAGLWLAENQISEESDMAEDGEKGESLLPSSSPAPSSSSPTRYLSWSSPSTTMLIRKKLILPFRVMNILFFLLGFYLLCLPDDPFIPYGFRFLLRFQPAGWTTSAKSLSIPQFCWKSVGAVLTVYSLSNSPALQHVLGKYGILQYLGKISFSLYLVHQSVYQLFREPLKRHIWRSIAWYQYPGGDLADREPLAYAVTWIVEFMLLGPLVVFVADEFARYIEPKCLAATKEIEKWLTRK